MTPAALRLMVMLFDRLSPKTDKVPVPGRKEAVTAGAMRAARGSKSRVKRPFHMGLRLRGESEPRPRDLFFQNLRSILNFSSRDSLSLVPFRPSPPEGRAGTMGESRSGRKSAKIFLDFWSGKKVRRTRAQQERGI